MYQSLDGRLTLTLTFFSGVSPLSGRFVAVFPTAGDMFHNSSQKKYWIFKSEDEIELMRCKANQKFRNKALESRKVSCD